MIDIEFFGLDKCPIADNFFFTCKYTRVLFIETKNKFKKIKIPIRK